MTESHVIGVDFGTLSGRAVVVRVSDGTELGSAVHEYPHAVLEVELPTGEPLPSDWALQVPSDYVQVLKTAVPKALAASGVAAEDVIGIATDFTACTVLPTLVDGTPLCELPDLSHRPHAYVKLWKHHAAQGQADRINALAHERAEPWIARYGGRLSSEWEFAKGLQLFEEDPEIYARTERWVEAADWIVWQLCGRYVRNVCTAGYKAVRQDGQYPSAEFLSALGTRDSRTSSTTWWLRRSHPWARAPGASPRRPLGGPGCVPVSRWLLETSTPMSRRRQLGRRSPARCWRSWARPRAM